MKFAIVVFPGSNCDHDAHHAAKHVLGQDAEFVWHNNTSVGGVDVVILPGGFAHGDYLRTGAIGRFSPVMNRRHAFRQDGGLVLGICNGFQILLGAGLLPGAMAELGIKFVCEPHLRAEHTDTPFTGVCGRPASAYSDQSRRWKLRTPRRDVLDRLEGNGQVIFRYVDANRRTY